MIYNVPMPTDPKPAAHAAGHAARIPRPPTVVVDRDYDGYFERLVRDWVGRKTSEGRDFNHTVIHVTAGPYRADALTTRTEDTVLFMDFYSALRACFGALSGTDVDQIIDLL